mmetsp:Transcript_48846/g.122911  ORF Transcript_48846/g.122911 Transcript_48846/m.122911 type:complete len:169 (+) Transcript_48846:1224-1730(+)
MAETPSSRVVATTRTENQMYRAGRRKGPRKKKKHTHTHTHTHLLLLLLLRHLHPPRKQLLNHSTIAMQPANQTLSCNYYLQLTIQSISNSPPHLHELQNRCELYSKSITTTLTTAARRAGDILLKPLLKVFGMSSVTTLGAYGSDPTHSHTTHHTPKTDGTALSADHR